MEQPGVRFRVGDPFTGELHRGLCSGSGNSLHRSIPAKRRLKTERSKQRNQDGITCPWYRARSKYVHLWHRLGRTTCLAGVTWCRLAACVSVDSQFKRAVVQAVKNQP